MRRTVATTLLIAATCVGGCGGNHADHGAESSPDTSGALLTVTSSEFAAGGQLPDRYTCFGAGLSPPLRWSSMPATAAAVAVIITDPDASRGPYTHWVIFDLPAQVHELASATIPPQARQARNSAGTIGYTPPCPPSGTHHYHFTVVGLRDRIALPDAAPRDQAIRQIRAETVARGTLVATVTHP